MWHFIGKGPIWLKWSYCQEKVVWAMSKHLRPIPSATVENSLRNRQLNMKNERSENFKMLRNHNFKLLSDVTGTPDISRPFILPSESSQILP